MTSYIKRMGDGSGESVIISATTREELEAEREEYYRQYPPEGYGTAVQRAVYQTLDGQFNIILRRWGTE